MANAIFDTLMNSDWAQMQQTQMQQAQESTNQIFPLPKRPPITNVVTLASRARELFLKRMGGVRAEMAVAPNDFIQCHVHNDIVYVFFCLSGKEGVTKEQIDLFPSDTLITQFRMILA